MIPDGTRDAPPVQRSRRDVLRLAAVAVGAAAIPSTAAVARDLGPDRDRLDARIRELMELGRLPGLSAAVIRRRRLVWANGYGLANIARGEHVRTNTIFMLASVSKTFIATAVMQGVEDGLFDLDDRVNDVLPWNVVVPGHAGTAITMRHLLTHTSAIRDRWSVWSDLYADGDSPIALGHFLEGYLVPGGDDYATGNFWDARPGRHYRYSNIGASLAAYVLQVASGVRFDRWCEDRIFSPLGMTRTSWHLAGLPRDDVAMPYRWSKQRQRFVAYGQYGYPDYPDGALRTTAPHLASHLGMMMGGGTWNGVRILRTETVRRMLREQIPTIEYGQGLIWYRIRRHGRTLFGHDGGDIGVATMAFYDPRADIGVVTLANGNWRRVDGRWPLEQIALLLFDGLDRS